MTSVDQEVQDPWLWWAADPEMQGLLSGGLLGIQPQLLNIQASRNGTDDTRGSDVASAHNTRQCLQCRYCRRPFADTSAESAADKLEHHEGICGKRHCDHCCALFRTALECQGHTRICPANAVLRCEFCNVRCRTGPEKRCHEATCELNPDLCCEFCGRHFGHAALRKRHQDVCPRHPEKICVFCQVKFPNRSETVSHEAFCKHNPATNATQHECVACGETRQCLCFPCGEHFYCSSCTLKMVSIGLKDRSLLPLRCCKEFVEIGGPVDLTVCTVLQEKLRLKYQEAMMLRAATHAMYCPNVKCGVLIILDSLASDNDAKAMRHGWLTEVDISDNLHQPAPLSSGAIGCPKCQQAICFKCRSEWHEGMSCVQYQYCASKIVDEITKYCRNMHWMRCFECGHVVEKKQGCNHITCICGAQFCYLCGLHWGTCKCQIFSEGHALRHNRRAAGGQMAECTHCRQRFPSQVELQAHLSVCQAAMAARGVYECAICHQRFADYVQYRAHRRECMSARVVLQHFADEDANDRRHARVMARRSGRT